MELSAGHLQTVQVSIWTLKTSNTRNRSACLIIRTACEWPELELCQNLVIDVAKAAGNQSSSTTESFTIFCALELLLCQKNHSSWILLCHGMWRRSLFRDPTKDNKLARLRDIIVFRINEMRWALADT
jgi:hypothetical protein